MRTSKSGTRQTDTEAAAEVAASCAQKNTAQPGDIRYVDLNGDCRIDDADRYNAGNAIPKLDGEKARQTYAYATPLARIPRVDETECVGCNLCSLVCPVDACITMVEVKTHLPAETWEERSAACLTGESC